MKIFLNFIFVSLLCVDAVAANYNMSQGVASFSGDFNSVNSGVVITPSYGDVINIGMSTDLENRGIINADIDLGIYNMNLYNSGEINGNIINTNHDWALTQIARSNDELTQINVVGDKKWKLQLDSLENANIDVIQNSGANRFVFNNSSILIDDFAKWRNWDTDVLLNGENKLYVSNSYTVNSGEEIPYATDISNINVILTDVDNLHRAELKEVSGNKVLLFVVRETDYSKIFNDKRGVLLRDLRLKNPGDKLFSVMDTAGDMGQLQNAMNLSFRFNHDFLIRPIRVINNFNMNNLFLENKGNGVGVVPEYIFGNNTNGAGANIYAKNSFKGFNLGVGVNINKFHYKDDINDFGGVLIGANVNARKYMDNFWANVGLGGNFVKYQADYIYANNDIKDKPTGTSLYGTLDAGYDFYVFNNFVFSPFVGALFQKLNVLDYDDSNMNLRFGGSANYNFIVENIKYEYGASVGLISNSDMFAKLRIGFVSLIDMVGADVVIDMFDDEFGTNYRASINAKVLF